MSIAKLPNKRWFSREWTNNWLPHSKETFPVSHIPSKHLATSTFDHSCSQFAKYQNRGDWTGAQFGATWSRMVFWTAVQKQFSGNGMQSNSMQHNIAAYRGHILTCSKATLCNAKRVLPKCSLVSYDTVFWHWTYKGRQFMCIRYTVYVCIQLF